MSKGKNGNILGRADREVFLAVIGVTGVTGGTGGTGGFVPLP